ncbi:hypothetical protein Tco_1515361 [Tanacetum coccineum]
MGTIDSMKSVLTQSALDALCEKFHIPDVVHPELPGRNDRIRNSPAGKIGVYSRKFLKSSLCFIGISRYYDVDENCNPTFWANDDDEMDLFAFINHVDTTKVQIEEQEVAEGEVPLLQLTRGRVVPLAGIRGIDIVADDETHAIVADKPKRLRKKRKAVDGASGSGLPPKKLREDHGVSGDAGASTAGKSHVVLQGLLDRSTLATEIGATAAATVPFVTSSVTPTPEREGGGHEDYVTGLNLRTQLAFERFVVLTDSSHYSSTHVADDEVTSNVSMNYEQLFAEFNIGTARQSCLGSEVSLRLEHELREAEAAEAIRLRNQVTVVEAVEAARASELNGLKERNAALEGQLSCDELSIKASSLEFENNKLVDQVSKLEVKVLSDRVAELDANLIGMALHLDEEFYPCYLTTIAGRRLGCLPVLTMERPEEPSAEANYMSDVSALRAVNFPLLAQLESHKDASIADLMGLLHLEGPAAKTLEAI